MGDPAPICMITTRLGAVISPTNKIPPYRQSPTRVRGELRVWFITTMSVAIVNLGSMTLIGSCSVLHRSVLKRYD